MKKFLSVSAAVYNYVLSSVYGNVVKQHLGIVTRGSVGGVRPSVFQGCAGAYLSYDDLNACGSYVFAITVKIGTVYADYGIAPIHNEARNAEGLKAYGVCNAGKVLNAACVTKGHIGYRGHEIFARIVRLEIKCVGH